MINELGFQVWLLTQFVFEFLLFYLMVSDNGLIIRHLEILEANAK